MGRPTIPGLWRWCQRLPGGPRAFSWALGRLVPYSGSIPFEVLELSDGQARVRLRDGRRVRNHLGSVHAIALANLGELATGLAVMHAVDGRGRGIVTELCMDYLKKARGTLEATCRVDLPSTPGTHDLAVEAQLHNAAGEQVARCRARWRLDLP